MIYYKHQYSHEKYDGFGTSEEILYAIERITDSDITVYGSPAHKVWLNGDIDGKVMAMAWNLAEEETNDLFWGSSVIRRLNSGGKES